MFTPETNESIKLIICHFLNVQLKQGFRVLRVVCDFWRPGDMRGFMPRYLRVVEKSVHYKISLIEKHRSFGNSLCR